MFKRLLVAATLSEAAWHDIEVTVRQDLEHISRSNRLAPVVLCVSDSDGEAPHVARGARSRSPRRNLPAAAVEPEPVAPPVDAVDALVSVGPSPPMDIVAFAKLDAQVQVETNPITHKSSPRPHFNRGALESISRFIFAD